MLIFQQNLAIPNPLDSPHIGKHINQPKLNVQNETLKPPNAYQKPPTTQQAPVSATATLQAPPFNQPQNTMFLQPTNVSRNISPAMSETPPLLMYQTGPENNNAEKVPFSTTPEVVAQNQNSRPAMARMKPVLKTPAVSQPRAQPKIINLPDAVTSIVDSWEADMKKELRRRPSGQYDSSKKILIFLN